MSPADTAVRHTVSVRRVLRLAAARSRVTVGDRAYVAYMVLLVGLVVVGPVLRAAWVLIAEGQAAAVTALPLAWTAGAALGAIGAAVILGAVWGPAVRSPWLTRLLAESTFSRGQAFGGPLARTVVLCALAAATLAAVTIGPVLAGGLTTLASALCGVGAATLTGVVAGVALLVGQALGERAHLVGAAIVALGAGLVTLGTTPEFGSVAWLTDPAVTWSLGATALTATAALCSIGPLLRSLRTASLISAAARATTAVESAASFDVGTITGMARSRPSTGRHLRAVTRHGALWLRFLRRDAVGALRTPDRIVLAAVGFAAAAALSAGAAAAGPWIGAAAGVLWYLALAPLTDGIRHAATVAVGPPLYGVSTARLALMHLLLPTLASLAAAAGVAAATGSVRGGLVAAAVACTATLLRASDAAKPPLPVELLAPTPTPMGDASALARLAWASDAVLLAAIGGACAAVVTAAPWLWAAVTALVVWIAVARWRRRA